MGWWWSFNSDPLRRSDCFNIIPTRHCSHFLYRISLTSWSQIHRIRLMKTIRFFQRVTRVLSKIFDILSIVEWSLHIFLHKKYNFLTNSLDKSNKLGSYKLNPILKWLCLSINIHKPFFRLASNLLISLVKYLKIMNLTFKLHFFLHNTMIT